MSATLLLFLLLACSATNLAAEPQSAFTLKVVARGAQANVGQALFALFTTRENLLKEPVATRKQTIDESGTARFVIEGLEAGRYAVSVVYDEDSNGKLNTGFLGTPRKRWGCPTIPRHDSDHQNSKMPSLS